MAANLHGSVRATRDIDILVPRDEKNMSRVLAALRELPYGVAGELEASEMIQKAITIVGDEPRVDVLTIAWSVTFEEAWPRRLVRRIQETRVSYLGRQDLIASKQTGRPSDQADIEQLTAIRTTPVRRRRA